MIDVIQQINAIDRAIGARTIAAGEARTATIRRSYDADIEDVWDACTNPERLPRWFLPVSGDLRLGGRYQFEGNAGGTIEACEPPHSFAATWEFAGGVSWIEVRLTAESGERTRLELEHIAMIDDQDEHFGQYGPGAVGIGWDLSALGLALYLSGNGMRDAAAAEEWAVSPEGQQFSRLSGEQWCRADIASGTDAAVAQRRSDNTIAFYTGTA